MACMEHGVQVESSEISPNNFLRHKKQHDLIKRTCPASFGSFLIKLHTLHFCSLLVACSCNRSNKLYIIGNCNNNSTPIRQGNNEPLRRRRCHCPFSSCWHSHCFRLLVLCKGVESFLQSSEGEVHKDQSIQGR